MTAKMTPAQKIEWAKNQRIEGNLLFSKKKYKEAIDVYLTCFVAMDKLFPQDCVITSESGVANNMASSIHNMPQESHKGILRQGMSRNATQDL